MPDYLSDEEEKYNAALDAMCEAIRNGVFAARDAGASALAITEEAENALANALADAEDPNVSG